MHSPSMARVDTRYTCVQYRLYSRESLHSIQLYTLMLFVNFTMTLKIHITQSLLFECLLNVFGNTVTNHSRCTHVISSSQWSPYAFVPMGNDYWLVDYFSIRLTCSVNLCGRANMHLSLVLRLHVSLQYSTLTFSPS